MRKFSTTTILITTTTAIIVSAAVALARLVGGRYLRVAVAGDSMTPALRPDDFLVLRAGPPRTVRPEDAYGQIVAVHDPRPEGDGRLLLKRVIGLPGEALRVGGGVQVNGRVLDEPYAHGATPYEQHRGINRLAPGEYFVMGDNRGASTDSRDFGPVRAQDIVGTVVLRYWPPDRAGRLGPAVRRFLGVARPEDAPAPAATSDPTTHPLTWLDRTSEA